MNRDPVTEPAGRPRRADAQRNRERVLHTAAGIFATEGLSTPVHEIARRAGVGTGTVSRHFPTKQSLYAAVLLDHMRTLAAYADTQTIDNDPGTAFFALLTRLVQEGATHRGLAEALAGTGFDIEDAATAADCNVTERLRRLLTDAQHAGTVRADVTFADLKALIAGCLADEGQDPDRVIDVIRTGLRATPLTPVDGTKVPGAYHR